MARYIDADKFKSILEKAMEKMHLIGGVKGVDVGAVIAALDRQPTADVAPRAEWISVEERLPGVSGRYICAVKDKNGHTWTVAGDYSLEIKTWFGLMFGEIKNTVTHWMPLPEPPKGD